MYEAARKDDKIAHSNWGQALVGGIVGGLVVGALVVATGGAALIAVAAAGLAGGALSGALGSYHSFEGPITTGTSRVRIGGGWAARAVVDRVTCHAPDVIAQGSRTVAIEDYPAARISDATQCGGKVGQGCSTVLIGADPETYVRVKDEIPWGVRLFLGLLMAAGSAYGLRSQLANPRAYFQGLLRRGPNLFNRLPSLFRRLFGHPVDVATGDVVDDAVELTLPGPIPVVWKRTYCSAQASEETSLGIGGWALDWEQWVADGGDVWTLRSDEGRDIYFEKVSPGATTVHRRERLALMVLEGGRFSVHSRATGLTRRFAPATGGGRSLLRSVEDRHGNAVTLYYEREQLAQIEDTAGRRIDLQRDSADRLMRVEVRANGELLQWVDYAYHPYGELASVTDALGHSDTFEYDAEHRMVKTTLKNGVGFQYAYDPGTGRCIKTWGDGGLHTVELTYDLSLGRTEVRGTLEPRVVYWDDAGLVRREETLDGRCLRVCDVDEDGFVIAEGPTERACARHAYDARKNRIQTTDAAGSVTRWTYEGDVPATRTDPDGQVTRFEHDERGALSAVTSPTGIRYDLGRDPHGRLAVVREGDRIVALFAYDRAHNVVASTDARGATASYEYDGMGRPCEQRDGLGRVTRIERDVLGRPISVHAPDGTVSRAEYDPLGNVSRAVDALGQVTEMQYAGTGVLTRFVQPNGYVWVLDHDQDERLIGVKNPNGEIYSYAYDDAGRLASERTFDGRKLGYRYSDEGYLSSVDYEDGTFRLLDRDARGLLLRDRTADAVAVFERDALGRVTKAVLSERGGKVVVEVKRDGFGRVVEEIQNGHAIRYAYDGNGRRTERELPDGATTRYGYDDASSLAWVEHGGRRFGLERDALGREIARRDQAGVELRSAYDDMDRLVERRLVGGPVHGALSTRTWSHDAMGRVREATDSRWGTTIYDHDPVGQLLSATRGRFQEVFSYDPAGALRKLADDLSGGAGRGDWMLEAGNRLARAGGATYSYDRRGRRTERVTAAERSRQRPDEVTHYVWDTWDRLREVRLPDGGRVLFTYDAFGRRVRKEVLPAGSQATQHVVEFLWDSDELAADIDPTRGMRAFVNEPGTFVPMLQAEQGEVFAVVNDHLGMPKELVDGDGRVAWSAAHSAWGRVVEEYRDPFARREHPVESPFRLLGQYADEETGLCHTRFRYFDAEVGRWCSPDPLGLSGGANLNGFDGDPTSAVDPLGLMCQRGFGRVQSRINLANGPTRFTPLRASGQPVSAGWEHVVSQHFDRPIANNRSVFTISQADLRALLQSRQVVQSPVSLIEGGQFVRTVDVGHPIGTSALNRGGGPTSVIKVFTDEAGNLITAFPF